MVLFAALGVAPVTISLFLTPIFPHARVLACVLIPLLATSIASGLARLAACFRRDMDVITLFAGGTVVVLVVIAMTSGIVLASAIAD